MSVRCPTWRRSARSTSDVRHGRWLHAGGCLSRVWSREWSPGTCSHSAGATSTRRRRRSISASRSPRPPRRRSQACRRTPPRSPTPSVSESTILRAAHESGMPASELRGNISTGTVSGVSARRTPGVNPLVKISVQGERRREVGGGDQCAGGDRRRRPGRLSRREDRLVPGEARTRNAGSSTRSTAGSPCRTRRSVRLAGYRLSTSWF